MMGLDSLVGTFAPTASRPPAFYKGWFDGEIERSMIASVRAAKLAGVKRMEVTFMGVPNLEEVSFGSAMNLKFQKRIAKELKMAKGADYSLIKRYPLDWANHYWACSLLQSPILGGKKFILHCDAVNKRPASTPGGITVGPFKSGGRDAPTPSGSDTVVMVAPGPAAVWQKGTELAEKGVVIALNGVSDSYNLGGPRLASGKDFEPVYFLKRISKGVVFRAYPGPWQAYLEKPDRSLELVEEYDERPELRVVAKVVREVSFGRYGIMNDRFAKGFGARL